jgi:hypothetical protein
MDTSTEITTTVTPNSWHIELTAGYVQPLVGGFTPK